MTVEVVIRWTWKSYKKDILEEVYLAIVEKDNL